MDSAALTPYVPVTCRQRSALKIASNRRNAQKATGPKTAAGKRRASLNRLRLQLIPEALAAQLRTRGEDPREFCRLHRDLIAIFQPHSIEVARVVALMAETWWAKARRIRQWVAAGQPRCYDLDARLEELLLLAVNLQRQRHERWRVRLTDVLGWPLGPPADVRHRIERRLFIFGAKRGSRKYPRALPPEPLGPPEQPDRPDQPEQLDRLEAVLERIMSRLPPVAGQEVAAGDGGANESKRSQPN